MLFERCSRNISLLGIPSVVLRTFPGRRTFEPGIQFSEGQGSSRREPTGLAYRGYPGARLKEEGLLQDYSFGRPSAARLWAYGYFVSGVAMINPDVAPRPVPCRKARPSLQPYCRSKRKKMATFIFTYLSELLIGLPQSRIRYRRFGWFGDLGVPMKIPVIQVLVAEAEQPVWSPTNLFRTVGAHCWV